MALGIQGKAWNKDLPKGEWLWALLLIQLHLNYTYSLYQGILLKNKVYQMEARKPHNDLNYTDMLKQIIEEYMLVAV